MGIDEVGIDKVGIDEVGINRMRSVSKIFLQLDALAASYIVRVSLNDDSYKR